MKCHACDAEPRAICKFCGRAVCPEHAKTAPYCTGFGQKTWRNLLASGSDTGIVVHNAIKCGVCTVEYRRTY